MKGCANVSVGLSVGGGVEVGAVYASSATAGSFDRNTLQVQQ
jgi:hypothetical protein